MISIIICSREPDIPLTLKKNINSTIGTDYETIVIDNSENSYSIFSAYNEGIRRSRFPFLCFVHEDVCFHTENWGQNLITHLNDEKTGIIGLAGGKMMTKMPAPSWSIGERSVNIIQRRKGKSLKIKDPQSSSELRRSAILLDGVFLAGRRELFKQLQFDEDLQGFHGYDFDICVQSIVAGYTNYVVYDILLEHFSNGNMDTEYYINIMKIYKKWAKHLPLLVPDISDEIKTNIGKIEKKMCGKFFRRLVRTGFESKEIIASMTYFVMEHGNEKMQKQICHIRLKIFFERLLKARKFLFKP